MYLVSNVCWVSEVLCVCCVWQTDKGLLDTLSGLWRNEGANFLVR